MRYTLGLDLGQTTDFSALTVLERVPREAQKPLYDLPHITRFDLGTSYPEIVRRVGLMMRSEPLAGECRLVIDATGVGRPVVDMFRTARLSPIAITITGGDTVTQDAATREFRVPKREIAAALQVLLQNQRLRIAKQLPLAPVLTQELLNFRVKINVATGHDSYEAWREKDHDDLVLSVGVAVWLAEYEPPAPQRTIGINLLEVASGSNYSPSRRGRPMPPRPGAARSLNAYLFNKTSK